MPCVEKVVFGAFAAYLIDAAWMVVHALEAAVESTFAAYDFKMDLRLYISNL